MVKMPSARPLARRHHHLSPSKDVLLALILAVLRPIFVIRSKILKCIGKNLTQVNAADRRHVDHFSNVGALGGALWRTLPALLTH
jgi:hypothetical protein